MQPRLASAIVMPAVDGFLEDVRIMTAETSHFLMQPVPNVSHEVVVTDLPKIISMRENTLDAHAGRFDHMLAHDLGVQGWQVPMPEDDLPLVLNVAHRDTAFATTQWVWASFHQQHRALRENSDFVAHRAPIAILH